MEINVIIWTRLVGSSLTSEIKNLNLWYTQENEFLTKVRNY